MATAVVPQAQTPLKTAEGYFHTLELFPDRLVVTRTDILSRLFGQPEVIPLHDIMGVYVHQAQFMTRGWWQLTIIRHDHHSIGFSYPPDQQQALFAIRDTITELQSREAVVPFIQKAKP